jgi:hypothetical protein
VDVAAPGEGVPLVPGPPVRTAVSVWSLAWTAQYTASRATHEARQVASIFRNQVCRNLALGIIAKLNMETTPTRYPRVV